jgi:type I restriction enzyme S subunit
MTRYREIVADFNFPALRMRTALERSPQYGANERGIERTELEWPRYIRITDIDANGQLVPGVGVAAEVSEERYKVKVGDLLIARSGNTVGKCLLIENDINAIFAGYLIRFRFNPIYLTPKYVFIFAQLSIYWKWIEATRRLTGQPNINAEEYGRLDLPRPPMEVQEKIIQLYESALEAFNRRIAEANALLASIDDYLLCELGIILPPEPASTITNRIFRVTMRDVQLRHDPNFFGRKYVHLTEAITSRPYKLLREVCYFSSEAWDQKTEYEDVFPYLEISAIDLSTGDISEISDTAIAEAPSRARMIARPSDILVSTTRPSRGAITLVAKDQTPFIASTGFAVIRTVKSELIDREYLYWILRSKLGLTQMEQRSSGGNYPAITPSELKRIEIPLPDMAIQKKIVVEVLKRKSAALAMRQEYPSGVPALTV